MNFIKCRISRVLVLYIVVFSSVVTLFLTALQLKIDYNYGVEDIEQRLNLIKVTNIDALSESLWTVDDSLMNLQLEGLSRLPDVIYVEITDEDEKIMASSGKYLTEHVIEKRYLLNRGYRGKDVKLGYLTIVATKQNLYDRLFDTVLVILVTQAVKTFLVSLFILFVFNYLVTRHLGRIADFLESINIKKHMPDLELDRTATDIRQGDELDRVVYSLNKMKRENHNRYLQLRESQSRLSETESRFYAIFNSISDSIVVSDIYGNVMLANPAFNELFNYHSMIPEDLNELVVNNVTNKRDLDSELIIYKSMDKLCEYKFRRSDGSVFYGEVISSKVKQPDGKHIAYLTIIRDISARLREEEEKKQLMNELQQSQKMEAIGLLVGGIAHDFNNILGSIIGYSELASEMVGDEQAQIKKYLNSVVASGERASSLIKQLMAFSRRGSSDPEIIIIPDLINEMIDMLKPLLPSTIHVEVDVNQYMSGIVFDLTQIEQILLNICINARDAMKGRGSLKISAKEVKLDSIRCDSCHKVFAGHYVAISINDNGSGIPENIIKSIFEPFFTTKDVGEGTGMGLSVVHGILHKHDSHIQIETEKGVGTRFTIYMPAVEVSDAAGSKKEPRVYTQQLTSPVEKTVLVVDDEELLAQFIEEYLLTNGFKVIVCTDPLDALKTFQKHLDSIDLLITDQTMPQMTGVELIKQVHVYKPELPIILCSGLDDIISQDDMEKFGIDIYLQKPVKGPILQEKISMLLEASRL